MGEPLVPPSNTRWKIEPLAKFNELNTTQGKGLVQEDLALVGKERDSELLEEDVVLSNQVLILEMIEEIQENPTYQYNTGWKRRARICTKHIQSSNNSSSYVKKRVNMDYSE